MRLPRDTARTDERVRYGVYLARRLKRAGMEALAATVTRSTLALRDASRAEEDARVPLQEAMAERDASDDDLDTLAQEIRHALAARSIAAVREPPYTEIFPEGVAEYLEASLAAQADRYGDLITRLSASLPEGDAQRERISEIRDRLAAWQDEAAALSEMRSRASVAGIALATATEDWERLCERTWGTLVEKKGKKAAERFFPRTQRTTGASEEAPE